MKHKIKPSIIILFTLMILNSSCKKSFVNLTPEGIVPVNTYYATEIDIRSALSGVYNSLRPIYNNQWAFSELPSDNTETTGESEAGWGEEDKLNWNSTSANLQLVWSRHYSTISYCNILLGRITPVQMAETNRANYIAQCKFVRALMYFNLVRMFGAVPLVLTEITSEEQAYTYNRAPVTEVYTQIEKDLNEAAAVLPLSYPAADLGRVTSTAAKALLGKVYIFENKMALAEAKLAEIVPLAPSPLLSYDKVFGLGNDNNSDIIFSIQYLAGGFGEGNGFASGFVPQVSGTSIIGVSGASFNMGTLDLNNAFEAGDLRKNISIGVFQSGSITYYYARKFVYQSVAAGAEGDNDWPVLRYGDVLLLYAEALNENGNTTNALLQLNKVRTRAGLAERTGLSQTDARTAIRNDRRVELGFEGERWFDLIRWNTYVPVMQAYKNKYVPISGSFANILPTLNLYPIPSREITLNPNLTQNPGY